MAIDFNVDATVKALIGAIRTEAKQGWSLISSFVTNQSKMMAHQAAWITESSVTGALKDDPDLRKFFADQLADSVRRLAHDVAALTILTVEKAWNAAVAILWGAINKALESASMGLFALPKLSPA